MILLLLHSLLWANPNFSRDFPTGPKALSRAIKDDDKRFRRYAVRTLKSDIKRAIVQSNSSDMVIQLEARQSLGDFEVYTIPACISQLKTNDVGPNCATILSMLEAVSAVDMLREAYTSPDIKFRHKKKIKKAINELELL